jgi:hypothetical protein
LTTISAALIQSEYKSSETVANLEVIINSAIDTVNSDADQSIGYLSGTPGTVTVTGAQAAAIKPLIAMKLASNLVAGGSSTSESLGGISESSSSSTGGSSINSDLYSRAIAKLRSPPVYISYAPIEG